MTEILPRLRTNLDFMPSPYEDRPGLMIRDAFGYSDRVLLLPPPVVPVLGLFDGEATKLDLHSMLVEITGDLQVSELGAHLTEALSEAGFLENEVYDRLKTEKHAEFAASPVREASHAGGAYPDNPDELNAVFSEFMALPDGEEPIAAPAPGKLLGLAAPHASPTGAVESYRDAYRALTPEYRDRIFVILGTSHYGRPERFGLTRKNFRTPVGDARTETALVDRLAAAAPDSVILEDYCHRNEHSIEFQVAFLQHIYGPDIRILPILCGPYAKSLFQGGLPEDDEHVRRFLGELGELHAARANELLWVLGVDMSHIGRRYGHPTPATAYRDEMMIVSARDKDRVASISAGDARGFWEQVQPQHDDLNWCGSSPFYAFLKAVPEARGTLRRYQHWQIDPESVVSFAAISFTS